MIEIARKRLKRLVIAPRLNQIGWEMQCEILKKKFI
jgi:hypothetical protein